MSISPNDLSPGVVFRWEHKVVKVLDKMHVKPGKGPAFQRVTCEDIETKSRFEIRLSTNESLEEVYIDKRTLVYSYTDGKEVHFMDSDFSSVTVDLGDLGDIATLFDNDGTIQFKEAPKVELESFLSDKGKEKVIGAKLLNDITLKVIETRPSIKGEAAKSGTKPALVEGGIKIQVPPHINVNDLVILSKKDLGYVSKA